MYLIKPAHDFLTTSVYAFDSIPIPGVADRINRLGGWATWASYTACLIAFVAAGGYLAWDKITDHGGNKGTKVAIGAIIGSIFIASATAVIDGAKA